MNILAIAVADYVGFILLMAMLISSRIRRAAKVYEFKIFSVISIMSAIACIVDFFVFYCDGRPDFMSRFVNLFGNTYCFITNPIFTLGWCMFTELKLYKSRARIIKRYRFIMIPGVILVLSAIINLFVPIIFGIDENNVYYRLPFSYAFYFVEFCYIMYSFFIVRRYEAQYDKLRFFPIYLMIGPIFIGCSLQMIFYGISLIWVSVAVGITSIFMAIQNEYSYLDTLTGLYNRAYLDYLFDRYAKDPNSQLGGIMIDVDYFKQINDTFGHSVGDEALIDVARVITLSKPDKAMAVRFAGDEFILLMKGSTEEIIQKIVQNIRDEVDLFNDTEGREYNLSLSIGYTLFDAQNDDMDSFFKHMDDNMYEEKERKHSRR